MRRRRASAELLAASRTARDAEAVASGDPQRILRRIRNRIIGRVLGRLTRRLFR